MNFPQKNVRPTKSKQALKSFRTWSDIVNEIEAAQDQLSSMRSPDSWLADPVFLLATPLFLDKHVHYSVSGYSSFQFPLA